MSILSMNSKSNANCLCIQSLHISFGLAINDSYCSSLLLFVERFAFFVDGRVDVLDGCTAAGRGNKDVLKYLAVFWTVFCPCNKLVSSLQSYPSLDLYCVSVIIGMIFDGDPQVKNGLNVPVLRSLSSTKFSWSVILADENCERMLFHRNRTELDFPCELSSFVLSMVSSISLVETGSMHGRGIGSIPSDWVNMDSSTWTLYSSKS